jgi:hypothetical protein
VWFNVIEVQRDDGIVGQHLRLDAAPQAAQRQRGKAPGQLAAGGEIAALRVERDANLEPLVMHGRFLSGGWVACGPRATSRSATRPA